MTFTLPSFTPALSPAHLPADDVPALYVHIPFCFHKCHYCDFYSITRQTPERMEHFVDRLLREADQWTDAPCRDAFQTVFFGGGTPSLLPIESMNRLIRELRSRFDCTAVKEWTVEVNPATASEDYFRMLHEAGVNRISLGAQSFALSELAILERHHNPEDVPKSLEMARRSGFDNLNIDLIYAIPGQDLSSWQRSLEASIALNTQHISAYGLTYEPNTPMAVKKRLGRITGVEESIELQMMHYARERLSQSGFNAYEISNYSQPNRECQHNLLYWTGGNYIGLGPSAASHISGNRWRNRPHLGEWEEQIDAGALPAIEVEILTPRQRAGELAMLLLRLSDGLNFAVFTARTGHDAQALFADAITRLSTHGLIEMHPNGIRLTSTGLNVADTVATEFLEV